MTDADHTTPRVRQAPPFDTPKGLQFYARDSDGQWFYVNHAGMWCPCPPPLADGTGRRRGAAEHG